MKELVQWFFSSKFLQDSFYEVIFIVDIEVGWMIYFVYINFDDGLLLIIFNFEDSDEYQLVGVIFEFGKIKIGMDLVFKVEVMKFVESFVVFIQQLVVMDFIQFVIGYLIYMICNDVECIFVDVDFVINLVVGVGGIVQVDLASGFKVID